MRGAHRRKNMEEYVANYKKEKKLVKPVRKQYKRWKVGRYIAALAFLAVLSYALYNAWFFYGRNVTIEEYIASIVLFPLVPFIGALIIYAIVIGGGRDILMTRLNERIYIKDECFVITFTPKFKQLTDADLVEYTVNFGDVHEMEWKSDFHRLEILADFQYRMLCRLSGEKTEEKKNEPVIIYEYFDMMPQLMDSLEQKTGKKITGRN